MDQCAVKNRTASSTSISRKAGLFCCPIKNSMRLPRGKTNRRRPKKETQTLPTDCCTPIRSARPTSLSARKLSAAAAPRSEEHTSELQSQSNLVCRLLLEKKKQT